MRSQRIILLAIVSLPVLDIFTASTMHFPISIGALLRTLFMSGLLLLTLFYFFQTKQVLYFYTYITALLLIFLSFVINFYMKEYFSIMAEINFSLKTAYFMTMIFTALFLIQKNAIKIPLLLKATSIASIIISVSYWTSIFLKVDKASYAYDKLGKSGPFFAANELSVIILILLTSTMLAVIFHPTIYHVIAYVSLITISPMIGTKTALYGGIFIVSLTVFTLPFVMQVKKQLIITFAAIIFFITIPFTPAMKNNQLPETNTSAITETMSNKKQDFLSSRDVYVERLQDDFTAAPFLRKLFGMGYGGDQEVAKMAEMDFYDLFFSYGYIGGTILLLPLLFTAWTMIKLPRTFAGILLLLTIPLWLGISFTAGHIMFAPAVMSYLAIFILLLGLVHRHEVQNEAIS